MSKRFTDTEKWNDPWYRKLPVAYKNFWDYLCARCDNAGVWKVDMEMAQFQVDRTIDEKEALQFLGSRIVILTPNYWYIPGFIPFQFGELSQDSKPHKAILSLIQKHQIKGYPKGIHTLKDKDKEKEKDKDKEKDSADYKIPDPAKEPAKCLVLTFKTLCGVAFDDRVWDSKQFGRAMAGATDLLHFCKDLATAEKCLKEIGEKMDELKRPWTIETVVKLAPDWLKKNGRFDANASRSGLRLAIAERRSKERREEGLVKASEGSLHSALGNGQTPQDRVKTDSE